MVYFGLHHHFYLDRLAGSHEKHLVMLTYPVEGVVIEVIGVVEVVKEAKEVREVPTNVDELPVWRTFDARITLVWSFSGLARRLT